MALLEYLDHVIHQPGLYLPLIGMLAICYQLAVYVYNIFLHPLRNFPAPKTAAASCLPFIFNGIRGNSIQWINSLHEKYGQVVRVTPNELSFSSAESFKDIYGHRQAGHGTMTKDPRFYNAPGVGDNNIISANDVDHSRMRRIFSHAFSDKALKLQEPLFLTYIDKLIQKLHRDTQSNPEQKFDMVKMYNFTTFDVMGDLTFGEPLKLLDDSSYHPWVASMFANFRFGMYLQCARYYPLLVKALMSIIPKSIDEKRRNHEKFSEDRVDRRLAKIEARNDIWGLVLKRDEKSGLSLAEMYSNAGLFMIAGTETTATLLSGLTYYLLKAPDRLKILTDEIRSAFAYEEDFTLERLQQLKYLHACIEEGLRMYPPIANGLPRIVPPTGATISEMRVPVGATVFVSQLAVYRNPENFKNPSLFIPERWIDEEYASDKKFALQPFSTGPRNCLGKNMAYHEIRLILARLLYNFDLKLCNESENWATQKSYIMWDKAPLLCQVTPVGK